MTDTIIEQAIKEHSYTDQYEQIVIFSLRLGNLFPVEETRKQAEEFIKSDKSKYELSHYTNGNFQYYALHKKVHSR